METRGKDDHRRRSERHSRHHDREKSKRSRSRSPSRKSSAPSCSSRSLKTDPKERLKRAIRSQLNKAQANEEKNAADKLKATIRNQFNDIQRKEHKIQTKVKNEDLSIEDQIRKSNEIDSINDNSFKPSTFISSSKLRKIPLDQIPLPDD